KSSLERQTSLARVSAIRRDRDGRVKSALRRQLRAKRTMQRAGTENAVDLTLGVAHLRRREGVVQAAQQRRLHRCRRRGGNGRVVIGNVRRGQCRGGQCVGGHGQQLRRVVIQAFPLF